MPSQKDDKMKTLLLLITLGCVASCGKTENVENKSIEQSTCDNLVELTNQENFAPLKKNVEQQLLSASWKKADLRPFSGRPRSAPIPRELLKKLRGEYSIFLDAAIVNPLNNPSGVYLRTNPYMGLVITKSLAKEFVVKNNLFDIAIFVPDPHVVVVCSFRNKY
jgi:hypothetical protein